MSEHFQATSRAAAAHTLVNVGSPRSGSDPRNGAVDGDYDERFAEALHLLDALSDEHAVVCRTLNNELAKASDDLCFVGDLLDIGPGYGRLAQCISATFDRRLALEPNRHLRSDLNSRYDQILPEKWENGWNVKIRPSVILASQVLYYLAAEQRARCLNFALDALLPGGIAFLILDNFEGRFGEFLISFSGTLGISEHVISPALINDLLTGRHDIRFSRDTVRTTIAGGNRADFAKAISLYFNMHPSLLGSEKRRYLEAIEQFRTGTRFAVDNDVVIWTIRKQGERS